MKRRGFATLIALMMLGVVAAAIIALVALLSLDARTTARDAAEAQLRQLLVAGANDARQKLAAGDAAATSWVVAVPNDLAAEVRVDLAGSGDTRTATVTARSGGRRSSQTIRFHRDAGRWRVESAELSD